MSEGLENLAARTANVMEPQRGVWGQRMAGENIILSVKGAHVEGQTESLTEFLTEGRLLRDENTCIIEFDETELSGVRDTTTRLTIGNNELWLSRYGNVESDFCFQERQIFEAAYDTPYGRMSLSILPTQVVAECEPDGGHIDLAYVIRVYGSGSAFNRLNIHYQLKS